MSYQYYLVLISQKINSKEEMNLLVQETKLLVINLTK